jgi:hypothetical protein
MVFQHCSFGSASYEGHKAKTSSTFAGICIKQVTISLGMETNSEFQEIAHNVNACKN